MQAYFGTGSRGDVFVVRTSKPAKTSENIGYFDRVTVSLHILLTTNQETEGSQDRLTVLNTRYFVPWSPIGRRPSVTLRATFLAPARIWLAVIDFQNGEQ